MRAIRTTTVPILALGLLAGSAVGVAAQDEEATTEPSTPAVVTGGMVDWGEVAQEPTEAEVDGVLQRRGMVVEGVGLEMDDPRLTGSVSWEINGDGRTVGAAQAVLYAAEWRIENEEGFWSGPCTSMQIMEPMADPSMGDPLTFSCLYTGAGAYDGLSAYLVQQFTAELPYPVSGLIFEGDLPPFPGSPPAE